MKKTGLLLPLIILACGQWSAGAKVKELTSLAFHPTWRALIHYQRGQFKVKDPKFLLSAPKATLLNELTKTIELFKNKRSNACQFPARYLFLSNLISLPPFSLVECREKEFQAFRANVPWQNLSLVYASQNLKSASSLMGHIFLRLQGETFEGNQNDLAFSYFADLRGISSIEMIFKSLFSGINGQVALIPFKRQVDVYQTTEKRELWEAQMNLSPKMKKLLVYHLWELKNKSSDYFFVGHNCATFLQNILSIPFPDLNQTIGWVTPRDTIIKLVKNSHASQPKHFPSSRWLIKMIRPLLTPQTRQAISSYRKSRKKNDLNRLTGNQQALALNYIKACDQYEGLPHSTNALLASPPLQHSKTLYLRPGDSLLSIAAIDSEPGQILRLRYLPTSHLLTDDQRNQLSETELKIAEIQLDYHIQKKQFQFQSIDLYSVTTLIPYDPYTGGLSWNLSFDFSQFRHPERENLHLLFVRGAPGLTARVHSDIDVFALAQMSLASNSHHHLASIGPKLGFIIREFAGLKTVVTAQLNRVWMDRILQQKTFKATQTIPIGDSYAIKINYESFQLDSSSGKMTNLGLETNFYF